MLAKFAIGTNPFQLIDLFPVFCSDFGGRLVEAVERAHEGRVPPAVGGAVVGVGHELGRFATDTLQLGGQPAAIDLRLDNGVDALGDPAGPAVLAEHARLGQVGALDVWVVECAHILEDPLPRQLQHGLLLHPVDGDKILPEPIESSDVADVVLVEQSPLCIHDDRPGP